jgi:hypothetical protein
MDAQLHSVSVRVERKQIALDLKENTCGTFLRITEEVGGRRNSIIIPVSGLEQFCEKLNEVIKSSKTPSMRRLISSFWRAHPHGVRRA